MLLMYTPKHCLNPIGVRNMSSRYIARFVGILFLILVLVTIVVEMFTSGETKIVLWILSVPVILGIPVVSSIVLVKNDELDIPANS